MADSVPSAKRLELANNGPLHRKAERPEGDPKNGRSLTFVVTSAFDQIWLFPLPLKSSQHNRLDELMSKIGWSESIQTVANFGVVVGIVFLVVEMRQNTDAVRSQTIQDISRWSYDSPLLTIEHPVILRVRQDACSGDVSEDQRALLSAYYLSLLRVQLNRFNQARLGVIDEEFALNLGGRSGAYRNPFFSEAWSGLRSEFGSGFVEFVERELIPLSVDGCRFGY